MQTASRLGFTQVGRWTSNNVAKQSCISISCMQDAHLGFPFVSDKEVVGGEVSVHHIVAVHELHSCSSLVCQL